LFYFTRDLNFFVVLLVISLATVGGSLRGAESNATRKPFEGLLTAIWYIGPMNHTSGLDFTGAASGSHTVSYALYYIAFSAALLIAASLFRSRQIRSA
jgi:hypothetical protein